MRPEDEARFQELLASGDVRAVRDFIGKECHEPDCPVCPRLRALIADQSQESRGSDG